ncbi:ATP-binding protein [Amycolatopsis antarctica]|uniref:ATP-binding protein n=1 Tax=Amycolatopsis antarctica TaxID=1854586 RepID=A0A263D473_9PSEU|nr:ATP-binding protein [Amycolatopsis antarctica]OZM73263.1 ATP-binding protein [Amycolatopsis antarctica]
MFETESPLASGIGARDDIELRLGADLVHLPIIRSVAGSIAIRADFDLDAVADLRLAIDEAASTLIARAMPGTTLVCRFAADEDTLRFTGEARSADEQPPSTGSFGWRVLTTLADTARTWVELGDAEGHHMHIELSKRKKAAEG